MARKGTVYIAPDARYVPSGRMVEPETSIFHVHWENWDSSTKTGQMLEDGGKVTGADVAISWGRERCDHVLIRLGHTHATYFSAGSAPYRGMPQWPPKRPPVEGWWTPADEEAALERAFDVARSTEPDPPEGDPPPGPWTGGY